MNQDAPFNLSLPTQPLTEQERDAEVERLYDLYRAWTRHELGRDTLAGALVAVPGHQGDVVRRLIGRLREGALPASPAGTPDPGLNTEAWKAELLASRARTWAYPEGAGLLLGPGVLILTDGRTGVALREGGARQLPGTVSSSLMLLCETILMAQHAVSAREIEQLQRQRIDANSSSLSVLDPIS